MLSKYLIMVLFFLSLTSFQSSFSQDALTDTSLHKNIITSFTDTGNWAGIHTGFHFPLKASDKYFRGPVYKNWIAQISYEIRKKYISYPMEWQYWWWTNGDVRESSFLMSISVKLKYPIYSWIFFGQMGIGTGFNIGIPINLPFSFGVEAPIANNLKLTTQLKRGIQLGQEYGIFSIRN